MLLDLFGVSHESSLPNGVDDISKTLEFVTHNQTAAKFKACDSHATIPSYYYHLNMHRKIIVSQTYITISQPFNRLPLLPPACRPPRQFSILNRVLIPQQSKVMSWMDSWSRPSKSQATPVPFYLLPDGESTPYCHTCGRVIGSRRTKAAGKKSEQTPPKYCSQRCRTNKPNKFDREIERIFLQFLSGESPPNTINSREPRRKADQHNVKGDGRILVFCSTVEDHVFGPRRAQDEPLPVISSPEDNAVESAMNVQGKDSCGEDIPAHSAKRAGNRIRPSHAISDVNGSTEVEKGRIERLEETEYMVMKRKEGQLRTMEKERIKGAARRGVVFGFNELSADQVKNDSECDKRKCEAVMAGKVVEPSFAKGDWAIRWRE